MCEEYPELEIPDDAEIDRLIGSEYGSTLSEEELDQLLNALDEAREEAKRELRKPLTKEEVDQLMLTRREIC